MSEDDIEATLTEVARLPRLAPDAVRSAEVHARCRETITRRARAIRPVTGMARPARPILATALVGALCVLYLAGVVFNALRVYFAPGA